MNQDPAEQLARMFHDHYERLAPEHGYRTRLDSSKPWDDVPTGNRRLMTATARAILDDADLPRVLTEWAKISPTFPRES